MPDVTLKVGGKLYGGWKTIRIRRSMEQIANSFELTVSERWPGQDVARPVRPGQGGVVAIDGEAVITGYVDDVAPRFDADSHEVSISGRDKTGDLVDCSVVHAGEWKGRTLLQVATEICKPFGIAVRADAPVGSPFRTAAAQPGETAFDALERAARMRGLLLVADGQGGLLLTRASKQRIGTALVRGQNILDASGTLSWRDRYSRVIVKGQDAGMDTSTPEHNAHPQGEATDPAITRYRPLVLIAEDPGNSAKLAERARWEASVRRGRGSRATVTVQGWRHAGGLWIPNRMVRVTDDWMGLDADMLISAVTYVFDERGRRCEIEVTPPEAFQIATLPEPKPESAGGGLW